MHGHSWLEVICRTSLARLIFPSPSILFRPSRSWVCCFASHTAPHLYLPVPPPSCSDHLVPGCAAQPGRQPQPPPRHLPRLAHPELGARVQTVVPLGPRADVPRQGAGHRAGGGTAVAQEGAGCAEGRAHHRGGEGGGYFLAGQHFVASLSFNSTSKDSRRAYVWKAAAD